MPRMPYPEAARARANVVLYRMLDTGFITQGELLQARREPAVFVPQNNPNSPDWFLDWAYKNTIALLEKQAHQRRLRDRGEDHHRHEAADGGAADHQRDDRHRGAAISRYPGAPPSP